MALADQLLTVIEETRRLDPTVTRILLHDQVPPGHLYRQWTSDGRLVAWANPALVDNMPRRPPGESLTWGIPIYRT